MSRIPTSRRGSLDEYARTLPHARLRTFADAGHWPWLDRPELVDEIIGFLDGQDSGQDGPGR